MPTAELRKHLIELINKRLPAAGRDDENILNEINRLLEIEAGAKTIYELNEQQIDSINESRQQYKKGQTSDNSRTGKDWGTELTLIQQKEILSGLDDVENGRVVDSNQFWNRLRNA